MTTLYRFKVTCHVGLNAWMTFYIEVPAGNEQAAREEVELLLSDEVTEMTLIEMKAWIPT